MKNSIVWLRGIGAELLLAALLLWSNIGVCDVPVLQGATSDSVTQFSVLLAREVRPEFRVVDDTQVDTLGDGKAPSEPIRPTQVRVWEEAQSNWTFHTIRFEGLSATRGYHLQILDAANGKLLDERSFQTIDSERRSARIAFLSCMKDTNKNQSIMWQSVVDARPDLLIFLGDNVYGDLFWKDTLKMTAAALWRRYVETRMKLSIFRTPRLIPTVATWDDHDLGKDNANGSWRLLSQAQNFFRASFAQDSIVGVLESGPGIASTYSIFGQLFLLLDSRSFRAPSKSGGGQWGRDQEDWMQSKLISSKQPAWIANGSTFFGGYDFATSTEADHPESLASLVKIVSNRPAPSILVAGDKHYSEIQKLELQLLGYETFEVTSSGIHSGVHMARRRRDIHRTRRIAHENKHNFILAETTVSTGGIKGTLVGYGANSHIYFQLPFEVTGLR